MLLLVIECQLMNCDLYLEEREDLKISYIISYLTRPPFLIQVRLDYILSALSCHQNGYRFFFGLNNERKFDLQNPVFGSKQVLNFRWVDSLNYKFQYSFLTVSFLSLLYFFVGPFFFLAFQIMRLRNTWLKNVIWRRLQSTIFNLGICNCFFRI